MPMWFSNFAVGLNLAKRSVGEEDQLIRDRVAAKQLVQKNQYEGRTGVKKVHLAVNDWVLINKPFRVSKRQSKFSLRV